MVRPTRKPRRPRSMPPGARAPRWSSETRTTRGRPRRRLRRSVRSVHRESGAEASLPEVLEEQSTMARIPKLGRVIRRAQEEDGKWWVDVEWIDDEGYRVSGAFRLEIWNAPPRAIGEETMKILNNP